MASSKVEIKKSAFKDIKKLDKTVLPLFLKKIESLSIDPRPIQSARLRGAVNSFRIRIGYYRIVYQIDEAGKVVTVFKVGHRREVYRGLN